MSLFKRSVWSFLFLFLLQHIPIEALIKRNPTVALTFLQWFKMFFDENNKGREYHALEARGGQSMNMVAADSGGSSVYLKINQTCPHRYTLNSKSVFVHLNMLSVFFFPLQMTSPPRPLIRNWRLL